MVAKRLGARAGMGVAVVAALYSLDARALELDPAAPGKAGRENTVRIHSATPGWPVVLLGYEAPPGTATPSSACTNPGGDATPIGPPVMVDTSGEVEVTFSAPGPLEGTTTWLQALQPATCDASPLVQVDWPPHVVRDLGTADVLLRAEASGHQAGSSVDGGGDANGDGLADLLVGARAGRPISRGAAYAVFGRANWGDGEGDLGDADVRLYGESDHDDAGRSVSFAGDTDGDGFDDLLVGAPFNGSGNPGGTVYLLSGTVRGAHDLQNADTRLLGNPGSYLGMDVSKAGDTDGDGFDDLLVGASHERNQDLVATGAAFLVRSPIAGDLDIGLAADARLVGESDQANTGAFVAGGEDVDGDGRPDLLIGGSKAVTEMGFDSGAAYLVSGGVSGDLQLLDADVRLVGAHARNGAGYGVGLADLTGDGSADMVVGAAAGYAGSPGSVHVVTYRGPMNAQVDAVADATLRAEALPNPWSVSRAAGDTNGDGFDDLLLGVQQQDVAYLVLGPIQGTIDLARSFSRRALWRDRPCDLLLLPRMRGGGPSHEAPYRPSHG